MWKVIHLFLFAACSFRRCQFQMRLQTCLMSREILALDQLEAEERADLLAVKVMVALETIDPAVLVILTVLVVPLTVVVDSVTQVQGRPSFSRSDRFGDFGDGDFSRRGNTDFGRSQSSDDSGSSCYVRGSSGFGTSDSGNFGGFKDSKR